MFRGLIRKVDMLLILTLIVVSKCFNDLYECLILTLGHGSLREQLPCSSGIVNQCSVLLLGGL